MTTLWSGMIGKGSQACLALYNIARGMEIKRITYAVRDQNHIAKLFYANMGFGEPTNPNRINWVVTVK